MSTFEIVGLVTDQAKTQIQMGLAQGIAIQITHFSVGDRGYDPSDPFNALTPDVTMTSPTDQIIFPPVPITNVEEDDESELSPTYVCDLPAGTVTGVLTSLYLWATILNDAQVEAELNANDPPFTAQQPPPAGFLPLNFLSGVPLLQDLPTTGNSFGDARTVAITALTYYWNGDSWAVLRQRFLFAIVNMPYSIKFQTEDDTFKVALQF